MPGLWLGLKSRKKSRKFARDLKNASFGQLDGDPQIDLGHDLIEPIVAGRVVEIGGHGFKP